MSISFDVLLFSSVVSPTTLWRPLFHFLFFVEWIWCYIFEYYYHLVLLLLYWSYQGYSMFLCTFFPFCCFNIVCDLVLLDLSFKGHLFGLIIVDDLCFCSLTTFGYLTWVPGLMMETHLLIWCWLVVCVFLLIWCPIM